MVEGNAGSNPVMLQCQWEGCSDRYDDPETCGKAFKRPQDLRKHEKIHTEEHHVKHKQSKAVTNPSTASGASGADAKDAHLKAGGGQLGYAKSSSAEPHGVPSPLYPHMGQASTNGMMPYMPFPFGFGVGSVEQQAGLAELLLQQQRLNVAAAQLIGMPAHMQPQSLGAQMQLPAQNQPGHLAPGLQGLPYAPLLLQSIMGMQQPQAQAQQQISPVAHQHQHHLPTPPSAQPRHGGLYPDLNLFKDENTPVEYHHHHHHQRESSSASGSAPSPSSSHHSHSHYAKSVSPHPSMYPGTYHPAPLAEKSNTVLGKTKRSFTDEVDLLLGDLKKKKFDQADPTKFDQRLDSLSSYLFEQGHDTIHPISESFSSVPSFASESKHSPSDFSSRSSSHSQSSHYSPRSQSGGLQSPDAAPFLEMSKNDIDDINSLLFSFGAPYDGPSPPHAHGQEHGPEILGALEPWPASTSSTLTSHSHSHALPRSQDGRVQQPTSAPASAQQPLYPSLSGLGATKPIKPLPNTAYRTSNAGMVSPPFSYNIAPTPAIPTPHISAEYIREATMTSMPLLGRAPPVPASMRHLLHDDEQQREVGKQVSSLRSTVEEDEKDSTDSDEVPRAASPEAMSEDEEPVRLAPMHAHAESERHLPSLRSVLANPEKRSNSVDSSPTLTSSSFTSSSSAHTHKRPTRTSTYPSLSGLGSSFPSSSASNAPDAARPSTGDKLTHITNGVGAFRMSSIDDYDRPVQIKAEESESSLEESDDEAKMAAKRLRTRSPSFTHRSDDAELLARVTRKKRLLVIRALVARANELYREQLAHQKHTKQRALVVVKEEEIED